MMRLRRSSGRPATCVSTPPSNIALVGDDAIGTALLIAFDHGRLVQSGPGGECGIGEAKRKVERMQVTGAHIEATAVVGITADQFSHACPVEVFDLLVVVLALQEFDVSLRFRRIAGFVVRVGYSRF